MDNETLHSLIPLADFKAILGIDDREDPMSRYCLITATYSIEQYCLQRLFLKKHFERIEVLGDLLLPLREYPVREVLAVYVLGEFGESGELIEPDFYRVIPELEAETGERPGTDAEAEGRGSPSGRYGLFPVAFPCPVSGARAFGG